MSILKNILKAFKGGVSEVGESIIDANATRILEQEIREAVENIRKAKQSLTAMKASEIKLSRDINRLKEDLAAHESKALRALEAGEEALAGEVAEHMAEIQSEIDEFSAEYGKAVIDVKKIHSSIKRYEKTIQKNKRDLDKVKTVDQLQKATSAISSNIAAVGSSDSRVSQALDRVKAKQQNFDDKLEAGAWMAGESGSSDLDRKLAKAGISDAGVSGNDILAKLKAKQAASQS